MAIDYVAIVKVLFIAIVIYFVLKAWDEVVKKTMFDYLELDEDKTSSWLIVAIIATIIGFALLSVMDVKRFNIFNIRTE